MNGFVARQPIFDARGEVFAYELLFRPGPDNAFGPGDRDRASTSLIRDTLEVFGFDALTQGRRAFVNVTRKVLVSGLYRALPPARTVLELLETVEADDEVLLACGRAKAEGYLLALDDFVLRPELVPLLPLADFIKVDFQEADPALRAGWAPVLSGLSARLVAEKVETAAQLLDAQAEGFSYFQGYFFERPQMLSRRTLAPFKRHALRLLSGLHGPRADHAQLEALIRQEGALAGRLLSDLQAAGRGIESVGQARELLGERRFRRWASLVLVSALGDDRPRALVSTCLLRARFAELAAERCGAGTDALFLAGLVSALDVLVDRPREELLAQLPWPAPALAALGDGDEPEALVLRLVLAYERGAWTEVSALARRLGLREAVVPDFFRESVQWTHRLLG